MSLTRQQFFLVAKFFDRHVAVIYELNVSGTVINSGFD